MSEIHNYLVNFKLENDNSMFAEESITNIDYFKFDNNNIPRYINEYWTAKQRQANSIHEISYRACFKPQLPRFFIELLTNEEDYIYDPFSGRGTTAIESALLNRNFYANDVNPLSIVLSKPRTNPPKIEDIIDRLATIKYDDKLSADIDLTMFYEDNTLNEILSIRNYLLTKNKLDYVDEWIRMVATNRLTGHSKGFFSVYTMPPNQAVTQDSQIKINQKRNQTPEYRNVKDIIIKKSKDLLKDITPQIRENLYEHSQKSYFVNEDARQTYSIPDNTISLTVTSPPFLDVVQYADDNWLRCWFNNIDYNHIASKIVVTKKIEEWNIFIKNVFLQLFRITKQNGYVAFEVGEVRNGKVKLDENVVKIGIEVGFDCQGILINEQIFTKTSNIWGVNNNNKGTNTNRIVIFRKR